MGQLAHDGYTDVEEKGLAGNGSTNGEEEKHVGDNVGDGLGIGTDDWDNNVGRG